jgi:hypothetical protein
MKKSTTILLDDCYKTPKTSLLVFNFQPHPFDGSRLQNCSIKHASLEGKDIYILDDFFSESEGQEMRDFSKTATFSRSSYGSAEAIEKGEKPAKSMNGKERWQFFSNPPQAVDKIYQLLGMLAHQMNAEVSTMPWELCDQTSGSPSVIANFLEEASPESMDLGKHQDYDPEKKISFGIPVLYSEEKEFHPGRFANGEEGRPWLISVMLYCTAEDFLPEYCMGTAFYQKEGEVALKAHCLPMRIVFFEGDIFHSIEKSEIPSDKKTWRVSYVFKLLFNPRSRDQCLKKIFSNFIENFQVDRLSLGPDSRI